MDAINTSCQALNLKPVKSILDKVIQLHETIQVRHGLMLVGQTMSGKTSCYNILEKSYNVQADYV